MKNNEQDRLSSHIVNSMFERKGISPTLSLAIGLACFVCGFGVGIFTAYKIVF
jgi:F0F1-type ATP synthase membrane subunit c/vacuolar-type H+-ATPase subunit K